MSQLSMAVVQDNILLNNNKQTSGSGATQTVTLTGIPRLRITFRSLAIYASAGGTCAITIQDGGTVIIDLGTLTLTTAATIINLAFTATVGNNVVVNVGAVTAATSTISVIADANG